MVNTQELDATFALFDDCIAKRRLDDAVELLAHLQPFGATSDSYAERLALLAELAGFPESATIRALITAASRGAPESLAPIAGDDESLFQAFSRSSRAAR